MICEESSLLISHRLLYLEIMGWETKECTVSGSVSESTLVFCGARTEWNEAGEE